VHWRHHCCARGRTSPSHLRPNQLRSGICGELLFLFHLPVKSLPLPVRRNTCAAAGEPTPTWADMPLHAAALTTGRRGPMWPRGPHAGHAPLVAGPRHRRASSRPVTHTRVHSPGQTRRPPRGGQCQRGMVKTAPRRTKQLCPRPGAKSERF